MYIVLKAFASKNISASKGKVIEIKTKSVANSLLKAGVIAPYSKRDMSDKEKDAEIDKLNKIIADKETEIASLNDTILELEQKINELEKTDSEELSNEDENLDNGSTGNDGKEPTDDDSTENDDKSSENEE